jgi:phage terminase small subunit
MTRKQLREEKFCQAYVVDLNGTSAVIAAGYTDNRESARAMAPLILAKVSVQQRIEELSRQQCKNLEITTEWTLGQMRKLAGFDATRLFNEDGNMIAIDQWPADVRAAVAGIEFEEVYEGRGEERVHVGRIHKIKLVDKTKALEMLGKYQKLFSDRVELTGPDGAPLVARIELVGPSSNR